MSHLSSTRALDKSHPHPLQVLIPIYPDFNTFDANGPIEVLAGANRSSGGTHHFQLTIAAATELTTSVELVRMARDISITEAIKRVDEWDILLLPGGVETAIMSMIEKWQKDRDGKGSELLQLLDQYMMKSQKRLETLTLTVCTGSLFLGALGSLAGRTATTHWGALPTLKKLCTDATVLQGASKTEIVRARWVDSGEDASRELPRLITAGGVSCGVDATFYLLDLTVGSELAEKVAERMDYRRREEELQKDYVIPNRK